MGRHPVEVLGGRRAPKSSWPVSRRVQADPAKQWKITEEDWRNRDKYPQYKAAVDDMFRLTSTPFAPWIVLESDDKRHARVKALKIINDALEARLHDR